MENVSAPGGESVLPQRAIVVGREAELRLLDELADRAVEDGAQVVFVSGEAGIGKSTLVSYFLTTLVDTRWGVHVGQCIEYSDRTIPFGPVVSLIRSVLNDVGDEAADILGHHRADLAALLPEWRADGIDGASLTGDVDRLIDAISTVLIRAAASRPMALFVEDIHWADGPTRDVVASLLHTLGSTRVLVIVSERTGAVPRGHVVRTWLAEQRRFPNVHTLSLEGLSPAALAEQAEHILGEAPDDALVAELASRTGGNAYFASELLLARRAGGDSLPVTLADFLTSRIEQLDGDEQEVLRVMAVASHPISHRVLDAALPALDVGVPVRRLFDLGIITVEQGEYDFGHALMRESMLRGVLPFEAEDLHRRLAEAMVDDPSRDKSLAELATIAMHWAGANDAPRSFAAAVEACVASAAVAAYGPAAELAVDALRIWSSVADAEALASTTRDSLTVDASEWLVASNQGEEADRLLAEALNSWGSDLPDGRRALLLAKLAPLRFRSGRPDEATSLLNEAVALVGEEISPEAAQVHHRASKLALLNASIVPSMEAADRAIEIASEVGPETILVDALASKALGLGVTVSMQAGIELVHESRRRAMAKNLVSQAAYTFRVELMIIYFRVGPTEKSRDVLREGIEFATKHCGPSIRLDLIHDLAHSLVEAGNLIDAAPLLEDLLDQPDQSLRSLAILQTQAFAGLLAGALDETEGILASARQLASRFSSQEVGFQHRLEAELARRRGHLDEALGLVDAALELQLASDNVTFTRESILEKCRLVRTISTTDPARAEAMQPGLEKLIDDVARDDRMPAALVALMQLELALIDRIVPADEVRDLADQLASSGFGADANQTALLHTQLLAVEQPGSEALIAAMADLRRTAESSGMLWLADAVDAIAETSDPSINLTDVLDITDENEPPPVPDHGLTPREVEVLGYLARGLTNKEIGIELYVSHRTVSTHVSNLLSKLHLKNRSEAASKFHELGFAKAGL